MLHVVTGILYNPRHEILVAKRDAHKFQGNRWEFPGGKVEINETPFQALTREMHEELGIEIIHAEAWKQFRHEYAEKIILLDVWKISAYRGEPYGKEGQPIQWVSFEKLRTLDIPDANWEIIENM